MAGEHDTRLPVLGGHGLAAQAGEALQPAAPHQEPVYERLLGHVNICCIFVLTFATLSHCTVP